MKSEKIMTKKLFTYSLDVEVAEAFKATVAFKNENLSVSIENLMRKYINENKDATTEALNKFWNEI